MFKLLSKTYIGNTYNQVYIQTTFPLKFSQALIARHEKVQLMAVMGILINENKLISKKIEWQPGFGRFSYAQSQFDAVYNYIKKQENIGMTD